MNAYLIDTDWAVDVLNGQPAALQTLTQLAPQGLAVSVITYGELFEGAAFARDPPAAHAGLRAFLAGKDILPLTPPVLERFALVRGQLPKQLRAQIGDMDLLIAATALLHNLTLLTRNRKDFTHVPGLTLYQPPL